MRPIEERWNRASLGVLEPYHAHAVTCKTASVGAGHMRNVRHRAPGSSYGDRLGRKFEETETDSEAPAVAEMRDVVRCLLVRKKPLTTVLGTTARREYH
jgi:hypothetical protein